MTVDHSAAVLHWRHYADDLTTTSRATVTTMLFGCERWLAQHPDDTSRKADRMREIKAELEVWLQLDAVTWRQGGKPEGGA